MNKLPKISVIVPVYKAEKYLHRCVDSILNQTFTDFEVLLIDDGSPDRSGEICDEYAKKDSRVRVFHKENGGVSSARQCGLDNSRGEYVIHADPDDWVEPDMLECLYSKVKQDDADMVICDYFINLSHKEIYHSQKPDSLDSDSVLKGLFLYLHGSCWNKLVRSKCIHKYKIKFNPELSFCEDLNYNSSLLLNDIKISYLPKAFYHYDQFSNDSSIVRQTYSDAKYDSDVRLYEIMTEMLRNNAAYEDCKSNMGYLVVLRAFEANVYNSSEFRQRCKRFTSCVIKRKRIRLPYRLIYILSCIGLYRLMYNFMSLLVKIKQHIL